MLFEMKLVILRKMARLFEIEDKFAPITNPGEMTEELVTLEKMMKHTWEMVVLRMKVEDARETWGELRDVKDIFDEFQLHHVLEGVEEELGSKVDEQFYQKAIEITERIKNERIAEINDYTKTIHFHPSLRKL